MTCRTCGRTLFPRFGDDDHVCAGCRENAAEELPPAIEPKQGPLWQPVLGRVGGMGFGEGRS